MNCTNCGKPSPTDYCADCEQFRARLESLRAAQKAWRKRGMPGRPQQPARRYTHMRERSMRGHAAMMAEKQAGNAALPPGDRE